MPAALTVYPRVSEWIFFGRVAVNMAGVATIEFTTGGGDPRAVVRLVSFDPAREAADHGKTWFDVRTPALVAVLRAYVEGMAAPVPSP